jgi:5'-3' exonuclease
MLLLDLNQVCISNLLAQLGNHTNTEIDEGILRHMVLNTIRSLRVKFKDYGELIICCDHKNVWRKQVFQYYKANRRKAREQSELNWTHIFNCLNNIKNDLKDYFPYRVVQVDGAEADDVIGTITIKFGQMLNTGEKILILSGDKDFVQLQVFGNVQQFDPIRKKFIVQEDPMRFTRELIIKGDRGDGIPNILSNDDVLVKNERQKPVRIEKFINLENPREQLSGELLSNWIRNEQLIDLTFIPEIIQNKVIEQYESESNKSRDKLFPYFVDKKLKMLLEHIGEF